MILSFSKRSRGWSLKAALALSLALTFWPGALPEAAGAVDLKSETKIGPPAQAAGPVVRVMLAGSLNLAEFRVMQGDYQILDLSTGLPLATPAKGEKWSAIKEGPLIRLAREDQPLENATSGPLLLQPLAQGALSVFRYQNIQYRGSLSLQNEEEGLLLLDILPLEQYLYGVVGREMGITAPLEALKTQAVVSRTYAFTRMGKSVRYDVGRDTYTQVYGGYDAETTPGAGRVVQAVDETNGKLIFYDGQPIQAYFHSNSGGYTEDSENIWVQALPYLRAVPSPQDRSALTYEPQANGWPASSFNWQRSLTRQEIKDRMSSINSLKNASLGEMEDILVFKVGQDGVKPTASGRATELRLVGASASASLFRDGIRPLLGLPSTLFDLKQDAEVFVLNAPGAEPVRLGGGKGLLALAAGAKGATPPNGLEASYFLAATSSQRQLPKLFTQVLIEGRGSGHGLGMSQWGARGMALEGYNYLQIIEHYYNQDKKDGRLTVKTL